MKGAPQNALIPIETQFTIITSPILPIFLPLHSPTPFNFTNITVTQSRGFVIYNGVGSGRYYYISIGRVRKYCLVNRCFIVSAIARCRPWKVEDRGL